MYITVEQLIKQLENIDDKTKIVFNSDDELVCQVEEGEHTVTIS